MNTKEQAAQHGTGHQAAGVQKDPRPKSWFTRNGPGLLAAAVAVAVAFLAHWLLPPIPVMTTAVVLGALCANLPVTRNLVGGPWKAGLDFAGKKLMRVGIVLLGLKLGLMDVIGLGWRTFAIVVLVLLMAFAGTWLLGKLFALPGDQPLLVATGFSICGASAIGAMSASRRSKDEDVALPVALVTLCGTLAILVLPLLRVPLGLNADGFGRWVGASVHDVGQVVATAQTAGAAALAVAIIVKLTRVLMLAPMVAVAAALERRRSGSGGGARPPLVPLFVIGFIAMILLRSFVPLSAEVFEGAAVVQDVALAAALFGLGAGIRVRDLFASRGKALGMAFCSWTLIAGLGYAGVLLMS